MKQSPALLSALEPRSTAEIPPQLYARPSPSRPDWSREACPRFAWQPAKQLLKSVRAYQTCSSKPDLLRRQLARACVVLHRFWSSVSGADIPLNVAHIEGGLVLPHPSGIVIHPDVVIGPNCVLFQQVTLGVGPKPGVPRLGGAVEIGPGAKILGGVTIGEGALIGANAVVVDDVPAYHSATGSPATCRPQSTRRRQSVAP